MVDRFIEQVLQWDSLPPSITRGLTLAKLDRLSGEYEVDWDVLEHPRLALRGEAIDSRGQAWKPWIFPPASPSAPIGARCDCHLNTATQACDHLQIMVASVHDALARQRDLPSLKERLAARLEISADSWLAEVTKSHPVAEIGHRHDDGQDEYHDRVMCVRLSPQSQQVDEIELFLTRPKKRGAGVKVLRVQQEPYGVTSPPGGRSDDEVRAVRAILDVEARRYRPQRYDSYETRKEPLSESALYSLEAAFRTLMQTHWLYLEDVGEVPATLGPTRALATAWTSNPDGKTWSLRFVTDPSGEAFQTFTVGRLQIYLATGADGRKTYGEIKGDLAMLKHAPPNRVTSSWVPKILQQLRTRGIETSYGLEKFKLPKVVQLVPVPVATFGCFLGISKGQGQSHDPGFIRLNFRYGDHFLEPGSDSVILDSADPDGESIEIVRDVQIEQRAISVLKQLGLRAGLRPQQPLPSNTGDVEPDEFAKLYLKDKGQSFEQAQPLYVQSVPTLGQEGFQILISAGLDVRLIDEPEFSTVLEPEEDTGWWFNVSLGVMIDGKRMDAMAIVTALLKHPTFSMDKTIEEQERLLIYVPFGEGTVVKLNVAKVRNVIAPVLELVKLAIARGEKIRVPRLAAAVIASEADAGGTRWDVPEALRETLRRMTQVRNDREVPLSFKAKLRPYQLQGFHWLAWLSEVGLGGILADDMGLGKTVQVLAHILSEWELMRHHGKPVLIVVPKGLKDNWDREIREKAPILRHMQYYGGIADRKAMRSKLKDHDIVITTYDTLVNDEQMFKGIEWSLLIADEAHKMRNPSTTWAKTVRQIPAARRLCVTGTPVENRLLDLWSLMDFVEPGLLGSRKEFNGQFVTPIEKENDGYRLQALRKRFRPLLLRREKDTVASELPPLLEKVITIDLSDAQRTLYEAIRVTQHVRVREVIDSVGLNKASTHILTSLMKMRQVCLSPRLVKLDAARAVLESAKEEELISLLHTLREEGRKTLVFSSFTQMLDVVSERLDSEGLRYCKLTGKSNERQDIVDRFQSDPEIPVFLLSMGAGAEGHNITAADVVIILDPWWNPKVEDQAAGRAHRIGQTKTVTLIRLICTNTVEQKVERLKERKRDLVDALFKAEEGADIRFTMEDIEDLFGPMGEALPDSKKPRAIGHRPDSSPPALSPP